MSYNFAALFEELPDWVYVPIDVQNYWNLKYEPIEDEL